MYKKKEPNIRFKGFSVDWEQRKLGDIVGSVIGGGTPKTSIDGCCSDDFSGRCKDGGK